MRPIPKSSYNDATNLLNPGESVREVARKISISPSTVCRIRKSLKPELKNSKGGRPASLFTEDKRYCVRLVTKEKVDNAVKVKK
ncbi:hypothetical protein BDF21DRAFT_421508 [Thamnidium elegans]|nr:hypothetical protein BDF21DRAFT_421508 [Thamnidium elegans]